MSLMFPLGVTRHPKEYANSYYGYFEDILECDFNSFKLVMLDTKWYRLRMHEHGEERTVIQHANRFLMIKTIVFEGRNDRYVFPSQCEQVFHSKVPDERDWSFVVIHDLEGSTIEYIVEEDVDIKEEEDGVEE